jgi:hypothetical protein
VAPEDNPNSAEPTETLKERLQEGFAKGWAKGWRQRDFQKQTMSCTEISKKNDTGLFVAPRVFDGP